MLYCKSFSLQNWVKYQWSLILLNIKMPHCAPPRTTFSLFFSFLIFDGFKLMVEQIKSNDGINNFEQLKIVFYIYQLNCNPKYINYLVFFPNRINLWPRLGMVQFRNQQKMMLSLSLSLSLSLYIYIYIYIYSGRSIAFWTFIKLDW